MNSHIATLLILFGCIVTLVIPSYVLAIPYLGDDNVALSGDQTYDNLINYNNSISTPGTSVIDITGINAVNFPYIIAYVTVNSKEGRTGQLNEKDFEVYENGNLTDIISVSFPDNSTKTKLDLAIVFDDTGSMDDRIASLKAKVNELTSNISSANIDCRYSLISFKDTISIKQEWTSDPTVIKKAVDGLYASGGDDDPEADLDALEATLDMGFRSDAQHMILDITDTKTHYRNDGTSYSNFTIPETASHLMNNGISYILIGPAPVSETFDSSGDKRELVRALGGSGLFIDINNEDFTEILNKIESIITQTYTIGYYTKDKALDGKKSNVKVVVGTEEDTGQYNASFILLDNSDVSLYSSSETDSYVSKLSNTTDYGLDITGIDTTNYPYVVSSVLVNTTALGSEILKKGDFSLFEDGKPVNITSFSFSDNSDQTRLDLAIVFDDTGSMADEIDDMKQKVNDLINMTVSLKTDYHYSLVSFKDKATVLQPWTSDPEIVREATARLNASEGFDASEVDLDAIEAVLGMGFRPAAQHMILDITDETTHYRNDRTKFANYTLSETATHMMNNDTSYILVGPTKVSVLFSPDNDKRGLVEALGNRAMFVDIHYDDFRKVIDSVRSLTTRTYTLGYRSPNRNAEGKNSVVLIKIGKSSDSEGYAVPVEK